MTSALGVPGGAGADFCGTGRGGDTRHGSGQSCPGQHSTLPEKPQNTGNLALGLSKIKPGGLRMLKLEVLPRVTAPSGDARPRSEASAPLPPVNLDHFG